MLTLFEKIPLEIGGFFSAQKLDIALRVPYLRGMDINTAVNMTDAEWQAYMANRRDAQATQSARAEQADRIAYGLGRRY